MRRSAAHRIAFIFAMAFALATTALGAAVLVAADAQFRAQRDRDITEEIEQLREKSNRFKMLDEIAEREAAIGSQPFGYALFDRRTGHQVGGSLRLTAMPPVGFGTVTLANPKQGMDRAQAKTIDLAYGDRLSIGVLAARIEAIDATILGLFGVAFLAVLAISVAGALMLAHYLRRRLFLISGTARAIVGGDLTQRVPVTGRADEFDEAAAAVNAMLDRIAQLLDNLRQVSSDLAHDLRTPLLRLRGQLDRLPDDPHAADRAIEEGDRLLALFGAILRINEVEAGALSASFAPVDVSALIADLGESYQMALGDGGRTLAWHVAPNILVLGHAELLAQAVTNLLDNCRIHTPVGTRIGLTLAADADMAMIAVTDDGPGVAANDRDRVLERFVRTDASRSTPGSGLGLSLAAAVARAHRGNIELGDANPGLLVTLRLPRFH